MIYCQFRIRNFKGISEVIIDLASSRIITLVGLNESGKTTIMEAISFFYEVLKGKMPSGDKLKQLRPKGIDFTGNIEIEAVLRLEEADCEMIRAQWKTLGKKKPLQMNMDITAGFSFRYDLHEHQETLEKFEWSVKQHGATKDLSAAERKILADFIKAELVPEILFYEDFIFEIPDMIHFNLGDEEDEPAPVPVQASQQGAAVSPPVKPRRILSDEEKKNRNWQLVLDDILKAVQPRMTSFQKEVAEKWQDDKDNAANRVSKMENLLNAKITAAWKALFERGDKKLNFREIKLDCEPDPEENRLNVSFKVRTDAGQIFSINDRSKGCKWFFSFLLFTELRKNRSRNILFLLDEPASNLHSSAQTKILEALRELSRDAFVIYSTHSHHLINIDWLPGAYVVINEVISDTTLEGNMSFEEGAKISAKRYFTYVGEGYASDNLSYIKPILDALDYQPSPLEPVPDIVITEGRNDWYTFKFFNELLMSRKYNLRFYPGAGADKLHDPIRLYLSWGKDFLVILDGDGAGEDAKQEYVGQFPGFLEDRIFTLKDAIGVGEATEALIESGDQQTIIDEVYGEGSYAKIQGNPGELKANLNRCIIQLLIQRKTPTLSQTTMQNFEVLFTFLSKKLHG